MPSTAIIIPEDALNCIARDTIERIVVRLEGCSNDIVVDRDFVPPTPSDPDPDTGSGDGGGTITGTVTLNTDDIFAFPDTGTISTLYSLGFAVIIGPALVGYLASRIILALRSIN